MAITRKDMNELAALVAAVHINGGVIGSRQLAGRLADLQAKSNPNFDRELFMKVAIA